MAVSRLNHAVLFVRDLDVAVAFYREVFDFEELGGMPGRMAFLRARGSSNHHDLGLAAVGSNAPHPPRGATGLYHLAWEVPTIDDLAAARVKLANMGALRGESDHGASKSLYAADPDGNEFEVMWAVPREDWGEFDRQAIVAPLQLGREVEKYGRGEPTPVQA
ncbi:MAG: VOC family protein [Dehalococcoidia bacterium]|nr:VOC family protein [Dehalococcoidia bacterium]